MKTKIIGIIAIIIVIGLVAVGFSYFSYTGEETYWETETDFGIWQEELLVTYENGETHSLKILMDNQDNLLSVVKYGGQPITKVQYVLSATATGIGYTQCEIQPINIRWTIKNSAGTVVVGPRASSTPNTIFALGKTVELLNFPAMVDQYMDGLSPGTYTLSFYPTYPDGDPRYRGLPGGNWIYVNHAPGRTITLVLEDDPVTAQIVVVLTSKTRAT